MKLKDIRVGDRVRSVNGRAIGRKVRSQDLRKLEGRVVALDPEGDDYVWVMWDEATRFGQWHWSRELEPME